MPTRFDSVEWRATDNQRQFFGTNDDISLRWDGSDLIIEPLVEDTTWTFGQSNYRLDVEFAADTTGAMVKWDASRFQLSFADNAILGIGGAENAAGDMRLAWDATRLTVTPALEDTTWRFGTANVVMDVVFISDTTGQDITYNPDLGGGGLLNFPSNTTAAAAPRLQIVDLSGAATAPAGRGGVAGMLGLARNTTGLLLYAWSDTTSVSGIALTSTP